MVQAGINRLIICQRHLPERIFNDDQGIGSDSKFQIGIFLMFRIIVKRNVLANNPLLPAIAQSQFLFARRRIFEGPAAVRSSVIRLGKRTALPNALIILRRVAARDLRLFHLDIKVLFYKIDSSKDREK